LFRKSIKSDRLKLREDDVLIVYTDGVTEAMNPQRECFGEERLLESIRKYGSLKVEPMVDKIHDEITIFTGGQAQSDDITLVAIREKMKAEDVIFSRRKKLFELVNKEGKSIKDACKETGLSKTCYYKFKKKYEKYGVKALKEDTGKTKVEEKHISIEDKAKIYDIIRKNPELGPKKISKLLNTEEYDFTEIPEAVIYEELKRERLNTKELRVAFVEKGTKGKRLKRPGTPFISIEGNVVMMPDKPKLMPKLPLPEQPLSPKIGEAYEDTGDEIFETEEVNGETTGRVDDKEGDKKEDFVWGSAVFSDEELLGDSILEDMDDEKADKTDELFNDDEAVFSDESFKQEEFDDSITSSIAEDLLGEELGEENTTQGTDDEYEQRESFVEIMKDMGFDRTTVLPNSTETKRKQTESAVKELNVKRYVESGLWFYKQGLYNKARDEFQKAIDEDPNYLEASQYMGDTLYRLGKLDEAKKIYEEVRKLDPDNVYVLENLGVILANQGEYKKAVWLWGEVLKLNPARRDIIDKIRHLQKIIRQKYS